MASIASPLRAQVVPFSEVRHEDPDDCLHIESLDVRGTELGWLIPPHRHENLAQFVLIEQGHASVTLDARCISMQAPSLLYVAPGAVHHLVYRLDTAGQILTVPMSLISRGLEAVSGLAFRLKSSSVVSLDASQVREVRHLFDLVAAEFNGAGLGRAEALRAAALLVAIWSLRQAGSLPKEEPRLALRDTLVNRYRALVEQHFREHWSAARYAQALKVTPDHLCRACRSVTGLSTLELLQERLLLEARRMLAYSPASVQDVAWELGFQDVGYFRRVFARRAGLSPSAYRAALQDGMALPEPA